MKNHIYVLTIRPLLKEGVFAEREHKYFSSRKRAVEKITSLFMIPEFSNYQDNDSFEAGRHIVCENGNEFFIKLQKQILN